MRRVQPISQMSQLTEIARTRNWLRVPSLIWQVPVFIACGLHIALVAHVFWRYARVPALLSIPALFGLEVAILGKMLANFPLQAMHLLILPAYIVWIVFEVLNFKFRALLNLDNFENLITAHVVLMITLFLATNF